MTAVVQKQAQPVAEPPRSREPRADGLLTIYLPPVPAALRKALMRGAARRKMRLDDFVLWAAEQAATGPAPKRGGQPCCAKCAELEALVKRLDAKIARMEADQEDAELQVT